MASKLTALTDRIGKTAQLFLLSSLLVAATVAAFLPALSNGFISYDDPDYVVQNTHVTSGLAPGNILWAFETRRTGNWHPLTWLSHQFDVQLFGLNPAGHHFNSLLLHSLNAVLLFLLFQYLTGGLWRSFFVAGLFALHPLHVESVAWIAERKDVLSTLFFLLTLGAYSRYAREARTVPATSPPLRRASEIWYGAALAFFALGLMSKPMLVTVPFVLLLLDFWPLRRFQTLTMACDSVGRVPSPGDVPTLRALVLEKFPFFALSAISSIVTILVQRHSHALTAEAPFSVNFANAIVSCAKYLAKTIWPSDLAIFYPHPVLCYGVSRQWSGFLVALAALCIAAVSFATLLSLRKRPWLAVGWFWFLGTLVPVLGFVQVGSQALADRYTYIPLIGIFVLVSWTAAEWTTQSGFGLKPALVTGLLVLTALSVATHRQVGYWRTTTTVFEHALAVVPDNSLAHCMLAYEALTKSNCQNALTHSQNALAADPDNAEAHAFMGAALQGLGQPDKALDQYLAALRLKPWNETAQNGLAQLAAASFRAGDFAEAERRFRELTRVRPSNPEDRINLGGVLWRLGRLREALVQYQEAIRLAPENPVAHYNLGLLLAKQGHPAEAEAELEQAARFRPDYPEAQAALAGLRKQKAKPGESGQQAP